MTSDEIKAQWVHVKKKKPPYKRYVYELECIDFWTNWTNFYNFSIEDIEKIIAKLNELRDLNGVLDINYREYYWHGDIRDNHLYAFKNGDDFIIGLKQRSDGICFVLSKTKIYGNLECTLWGNDNVATMKEYRFEFN